MHLTFIRIGILYMFLSVTLSSKSLFSQTHRAVPLTINSNCGGYYEYLPINYNPSQPKKYPVIIFLHGLGNSGNGKLPDLTSVLGAGLPNYINRNRFPATFTVNGENFSFIVISPQFQNWPDAGDVEDVIEYIRPKYNIDESRIYLTGLSMGGGATWDYAQSHVDAGNMLAAIVPVCGASDPDEGSPHIIAHSHLPVWATHNSGDPEVPVSNTHGFVEAINTNDPLPKILAKKTIFTSNSHDAWTTTYNHTYRENGKNIYEWMLQYARAAEALPVVLSNLSASLVNDNAVELLWTTRHEQNNKEFFVEHSTDGQNFQLLTTIMGSNIATGSDYKYIHNTPSSGANFYRLKQADFDGKTTIHKILKVDLAYPLTNNIRIYPNPSAAYINLALNNQVRGELKVIISDNSGKIVASQTFKKLGDYWQQTINTANLSRGNYILDVKGTNFRSIGKFLKN